MRVAFDTIPAKLVKLSVDFLTPLLTKPLNTNIAQNVFPEIKVPTPIRTTSS